MSVVYVVQRQQAMDQRTGELVDRFDFSAAREFGELRYVLGPGAAPWHADKILGQLRTDLADFRPEDYLLLVGNPVLIGLATAVAADAAGRVNFLQWSGKDGRYINVGVDVFDQEYCGAI